MKYKSRLNLIPRWWVLDFLRCRVRRQHGEMDVDGKWEREMANDGAMATAVSYFRFLPFAIEWYSAASTLSILFRVFFLCVNTHEYRDARTLTTALSRCSLIETNKLRHTLLFERIACGCRCHIRILFFGFVTSTQPHRPSVIAIESRRDVPFPSVVLVLFFLFAFQSKCRRKDWIVQSTKFAGELCDRTRGIANARLDVGCIFVRRWEKKKAWKKFRNQFYMISANSSLYSAINDDWHRSK